jgi:hypothetical protein
MNPNKGSHGRLEDMKRTRTLKLQMCGTNELIKEARQFVGKYNFHVDLRST